MPKKNAASRESNNSAQPRFHQRAREIQAYGTVSHMLPLELEEPVSPGNDRATQPVAGRLHDIARSL